MCDLRQRALRAMRDEAELLEESRMTEDPVVITNADTNVKLTEIDVARLEAAVAAFLQRVPPRPNATPRGYGKLQNAPPKYLLSLDAHLIDELRAAMERHELPL